MSKKTLFVLIAGICLLLAGSVTHAADAAPQSCATDLITTDAGITTGDSPVVQDPEGAELSLEDLLASLTPDPETKAIDSGICCSEGCPDVNGYGHFCGASCFEGGPSCLYYRK